MCKLVAIAAAALLVVSIQVGLGQQSQHAPPGPITNESVANFAGENLDDGSAVIIADKKVFWLVGDDVQNTSRQTAQGAALAGNYPSGKMRPRMAMTLSPYERVPWPGDAAMTRPMSAIELMARYEVNEFLADERLRPPKSLYIDGVVTRIKSGGPEGNYIALRTDDLVSDIRCYFTDRQARRFRLVAKGDLATIRGSCAGRPIDDVILYDCKVVTSVRPRTPFAPWEWPSDSSRRIRMRTGFEFLKWPAGTQRYEVSAGGRVLHNPGGHTVRIGTDQLITNNANYWRAVRTQAPAWVSQRPN